MYKSLFRVHVKSTFTPEHPSQLPQPLQETCLIQCRANQPSQTRGNKIFILLLIPLCMKGRFHTHTSSDKSHRVLHQNISSPLSSAHCWHRSQLTPHTSLPITPPAQAPICLIPWLQCNRSFNICSSKGERNKEIFQESLRPAVFNCSLVPSDVTAPSMLGTFQTVRQ